MTDRYEGSGHRQACIIFLHVKLLLYDLVDASAIKVCGGRTGEVPAVIYIWNHTITTVKGTIYLLNGAQSLTARTGLFKYSVANTLCLKI